MRNLVASRGWTQPVGIDQDGQVMNRFGVGVCPTTVFARPAARFWRASSAT